MLKNKIFFDKFPGIRQVKQGFLFLFTSILVIKTHNWIKTYYQLVCNEEYKILFYMLSTIVVCIYIILIYILPMEDKKKIIHQSIKYLNKLAIAYLLGCLLLFFNDYYIMEPIVFNCAGLKIIKYFWTETQLTEIAKIKLAEYFPDGMDMRELKELIAELVNMSNHNLENLNENIKLFGTTGLFFLFILLPTVILVISGGLGYYFIFYK